MTKSHRFLLTSILVSAMLPFTVAAQSSSQTVTMQLAEEESVAAGSEFSMDLVASEGQGISSFALSVIYDPEMISFVKANSTDDASDFAYVDGQIGAEGGMKELILGGTASTPIDKAGEAKLANLTFLVKSTATGDITFTLKNPTDDIEESILSDATVTIGATSGSSVSSLPISDPIAVESSIPTQVTTQPSSSLPSSEASSSTPSESASAMPSSTEPPSAAEIQGPQVLDQTGPAETAGLMLASMGIAYAINRRRKNK